MNSWRRVGAVVADRLREQQVQRVQRAEPGNLAELGLRQRPEGEGFGVASCDRVFVLGEHREIAPIFAGRRQLEVALDLGRVVGDVLAVRRLEFGSELDKPVGQRAKAVFVGVSLVVALARSLACRK